jgi:uncharacterized protein YndB with AHSA1/START domain
VSEELGELRAEAGAAAVRFTRRLRATVDEVWAALTEPAQLRGWLAATTLEPRAGTDWEANFASEGERARGTVVAVEPGRLLELTWAFSGEPESRVRFELQRDGDDTVLVLDHCQLRAADAADYGAGWHAHLDLLEALVAGKVAPEWRSRYEAVLPRYQSRREGG